jgi:hypothetical protein
MSQVRLTRRTQAEEPAEKLLQAADRSFVFHPHLSAFIGGHLF